MEGELIVRSPLVGSVPYSNNNVDLDRSQPPLFIHVRTHTSCMRLYLTFSQMLYDYVMTTNDTAILQDGIPIAEVRLSSSSRVIVYMLAG